MRHAAYPWLLILPVLAALLGLAAALPVQLRIVYEGKGGEHRLHLWMGILNWRLGVHVDYPSQPDCHGDQGIRIKRSLSKRKGNAGRFSHLAGKRGFRMMMQQRRLRGVLANFRGSIVVLKQYLRHSVCNRLFWETSLGFDDHAATGLACGLCWAGKGMIIGALSRYLRIRPGGVDIRVHPQFGRSGYASTLDCILESSLGYIIIVTVKLRGIWKDKLPFITARRKRYA